MHLSLIISAYTNWLLILVVIETFALLSIGCIFIIHRFRKRNRQAKISNQEISEEDPDENIPVNQKVSAKQSNSLLPGNEELPSVEENRNQLQRSTSVNTPMEPTHKSVLLVEDDPDLQQLYIKALNNEHSVKVLSHLNKTISLATSGEFNVIIISESSFPFTVRYKEYLNEIRKSSISETVKIVVLAENMTDAQITNGYKEGVDLFLTKPISPEMLLKNINALYAPLNISILPSYHHLANKTFTNEDQRFLRQLLSLLVKAPAQDDGGIAMLAQRLAMSHSSLYKRLKTLTGLSVIEFSNALKIYMAIKQIHAGKDSIHVISHECGFRDVKSFRNCFKSLMGMPPSTYIKQLTSKHQQPEDVVVSLRECCA